MSNFIFKYPYGIGFVVSSYSLFVLYDCAPDVGNLCENITWNRVTDKIQRTFLNALALTAREGNKQIIFIYVVFENNKFCGNNIRGSRMKTDHPP